MNTYQIIRKSVDCFLECNEVKNLSAVKIWRLCYGCDIRQRGHDYNSNENHNDAFGVYLF